MVKSSFRDIKYIEIKCQENNDGDLPQRRGDTL